MVVLVKPGESIQRAISSAPPGTEIVLAAGTWRENIGIEKSLTLRGAEDGKSVLRGRVRDLPVIGVHGNGRRATDVTIEGLTVSGARMTARGMVLPAAIAAYGDASLVLKRNMLCDNSPYGVLLSERTHAIVAECGLQDNARGIMLSDSARATVTDCTLSARAFGVAVIDSARLEAVDCVVKTIEELPSLMATRNARVSLTRCDIDRDVCLGDSSRGVMSDTRFRSTSWFTLSGAALAQIKDCEFSCMVLVSSTARLMLDGGIVNMEGDGVVVTGEGRAHITGTRISAAGGCAVGALGGRVVVEGCSISRSAQGIVCARDARVIVLNSKVILCSDGAVSVWDSSFAGLLSGSNNTIPGPGEAGANAKRFDCPADLGFLTTERGGGWPLRSRPQQNPVPTST